MSASIKQLICSLFIFLFLFPCLAWAEEDLGPVKELFKIDKIEVRGNRKVEPEAVLEKIGSKPGIVLDNYLLRKDIGRIYSMKHFEAVEAHQETRDEGGLKKNVLVFQVKERPVIGKITLEGNDELSDDDLKEKVKTKEFSILDINSVKNDVTNLQKFYEEKGFYLASIDYEIRPMETESVEVVFKINELQKVRVKKIMFLGNKEISDTDLKAIMETREESFFSFLSGSGSFKEFNFQSDVEKIKYYYKTKGYLQVNVANPVTTISEDKRWVFITIKLIEGPKFTINDIFFEGDLIFSEEHLNSKIKLKKDDTYSEENLRLDIQTLTELYQDEGYAFANVLRTLDIVPGENKVDIRFAFEKGKIAYFGNISVKGNSKTRDKVVRRELKFHEGMRFSGSALRKSKENVNRLGFFENNSVVFNTVAQKDKDDVLDVEIIIKERNTGQVSLGAGYSTASKGFLQASISQNNFRGLGQSLSFSLSLASTQQIYNLGFTEPYLFDTRWTAGADVYKTSSNFIRSFSYQKEGFTTRVGHPVFEYARLFMTYKYEDTRINTIRNPLIDPNTINGVSSSVQTTLVYDKRDNIFEPKAGHYTNASVEYAGLGGVQRWLKTELEGRYYRPVILDELILRTRVSASKLYKTTEREIPRTEKFSMGGSRNMRGYNYEDIGPQVQVQDTTGFTGFFNRGGLFSLLGTAELEHPLVQEAGLKWVMFYDVGNVFLDHIGESGNYGLRQDYGVGFRWFSPIGVLRFELGFPVHKRERESPNQFHFDIGQLF